MEYPVVVTHPCALVHDGLRQVFPKSRFRPVRIAFALTGKDEINPAITLQAWRCDISSETLKSRPLRARSRAIGLDGDIAAARRHAANVRFGT